VIQQGLEIPEKELAALCRRWKIRSLSLFGSILREDFRPESDIDLLVSFVPEARLSLSDWVALEDELSSLLGRKVDVVDREQVAESPNYIRRRHILESAVPVYVEG
jgi:uncharacterized protein